ncbi:MAG: DEAD/DEAH box helicase [Actinomycetota bacterium]
MPHVPQQSDFSLEKTSLFTDYPLPKRVHQALGRQGFTTPTPIQAETLNPALKGMDILGQARTGTGKTLAFGLPIASKLTEENDKGRAPRALILTPTRELALQVSRELSWVAHELTVATIYGGTGYGQQAYELKRGCDVVVATPGRALDYLEKGVLDLSRIHIAVLDEADEMLSMGFGEDVEKLLSATPRDRQTLLFSATLPQWAKKIAHDHLRDPAHINVMNSEDVSYEEIAIQAPLKRRAGILSGILHTHQGEKSIIFTHTKAETDELAKQLALSGHTAEAINGDLNQVQRERVIERFRAGHVNVLIGTNVAARGLDIPDVDLVIHYRIPSETEAYQHRSGRTGRAGRGGTVVLLYGPKESGKLAALERTVARTFKRGTPPTAHDVKKAKLATLIAKAQAQHQDSKNFWLSAAEDMINGGDRETLAGVLAILLGGDSVARSLLTGEEGWVTLRIEGNLRKVSSVVHLLKDAGLRELGRIHVSPEATFVDVLPEDAAGISLPGKKVEKAQDAPAVSDRPRNTETPSRRHKPRDTGAPTRQTKPRFADKNPGGKTRTRAATEHRDGGKGSAGGFGGRKRHQAR